MAERLLRRVALRTMSLALLFWLCFALALFLIVTGVPRHAAPVFMVALLAILAVAGLIH
jgi:uncharacterized membrane protein YbhN (UPF0104 family)